MKKNAKKQKRKVIKKSKSKAVKKPKKVIFDDPLIEDIYETYIEFVCPKRGKVRQKVQVKKYKKVASAPKSSTSVRSNQTALDEDDEITSYGSTEEDI